VRFLRTTASSRPDYPFQAGQIIILPKLTAEVRAWIRDGAAELLPETAEETAVEGEKEQAVTRRRG
jgi:hypothetical protein